MLINQHIEFTGVTGIKHLKLKLSQKQTNIIVGPNGIGKTKALEALYALLMASNSEFADKYYWVPIRIFESCKINEELAFEGRKLINNQYLHNLPVVYIGAKNRGEVLESDRILSLGTVEERAEFYKDAIYHEHFYDKPDKEKHPINDVNGWFVQRALSSNKYQDDVDNREIEMLTVLEILNQIDPRISADPQDFKIMGSKYACVLYDGEYKKLSELSSGFISILKIVQAIVAGFGYFTNSSDLKNLEGYVLIDEIDNHISIEWQNKIMHVLGKVFPNVKFIVTSHSLFLLAQLKNGYAYKLKKDEEGCVVSEFIPHTGKATLIDLVNTAFNVDFNKMRIESDSPEEFKDVKRALAALLRGEDFEELYTGL